MKATGVIRRIDDLGRVVVPKEIRKTMRIKEGEPLEFYTEGDNLILKKYSAVGALGSLAKTVTESLNQITDYTSVVCDLDGVLSAKGTGSREYEGKNISHEMLKSLKGRKTLILNGDDGKISLVPGGEKWYSGQIIMPIIAFGDLVGGIVLLSRHGEMDGKTVSIAAFCADFIARQL
ncbi:MAG: AbrB/MazE/SpoVT family DNA-binding domain-containing protein [Clostridia bacterium]|nr:AbrB/MazE/SpoVT family DNA-binding domain-containing protein [Clostridia bacterium]